MIWWQSIIISKGKTSGKSFVKFSGKIIYLTIKEERGRKILKKKIYSKKKHDIEGELAKANLRLNAKQLRKSKQLKVEKKL